MAETKICPHCGGEILAVAKKCKHCGQWLDEDAPKPSPATIRCPICDEDIPADSVICPECGETLKPASTPVEEPALEEPQKKKSTWWIWILLLLLIGGLVYYILNDLNGNDEPVSRNYSSPAKVENTDRTVPKQSYPAPTNEIIEKWDIAHNTKNDAALNEIYADTVYYYQSSYTLSKVIASKQRLFEKNPLFHQESVNVHLYPNEDGTYRIEFDKRVWTDYSDDEYKSYPSYLIVTYVDSEWRITTESDTVTDANLANRAKKSGAN